MRILSLFVLGHCLTAVWQGPVVSAFTVSRNNNDGGGGRQNRLKGVSNNNDDNDSKTARPPTVRQSPTSLRAVAKKKSSAAGAAKKSKTKKAKKAAEPETTIKKSDLINQMTDQCGLSKSDTESALNAFLQVVQENVAQGNKVTLMGFGSFSLKERAPRKGRNPQTGEEMDIPASKSPGFSAGKNWKLMCNEK